MEEKINGIVLSIVKHSDRANVVTLYTREQGRIAVVSPIGTGRAARIRAARLQLLSVIQAQTRRKGGRELPLMVQFSATEIWHTLYFEPAKCALIFFLSDFLNRFLREAPPDSIIWDFIHSELQRLDNIKSGIGNFHLQFLFGIMEIGGIMPDADGWQSGDWFDYRSGEFCLPGLFKIQGLQPEEAKAAARILKIGRRGLGLIRFKKSSRKQILEKMLEYIGMHYPGTSSIASLDILRELF